MTQPDAHGTSSGRGTPWRDATILGRYRVLDTNDEGGFGTVRVCWDTRLQRRVAIKQMPLTIGENQSVSASTLDEALGEARVSSLLPHPNIVTVYDFDADDRYSYLVMEYVDGLNLADLLKRVEGGTLTYDECAHMLQSVASALRYAHENRVLHLDIKPANIMIDRNGTVKLGDFGMATLASAAGYGGARGGTIGYMPPEQIEGDYVDERTDVFSLAVVTYEALTGISPFAAQTTAESLRLIRRGPKPALSQVEPALAGAVEETLLAALDPDPANRMPSVEELEQPVVAFLGDPAEGQLSLADLIGQTESDAPEDEPPEAAPREPLLTRLPWLPQATLRVASAACSAYVAYETLPVYLPSTPEARLAVLVATGAITALWAPLGSALSLASIAAALFCQHGQAAFPLGLLVALAGGLWWAAVGRTDELATASLLLPACLQTPWTAGFVAGYALDPARALVTAASSEFLRRLLALGRTSGFDADVLLRGLRQLALDPLAWLSAIMVGGSALVCSLFQRSAHPAVRVLGELSCLLIPPLCLAALPGMENAGISTGETVLHILVALVLCVFMCIVTVLVGPHRQTAHESGDL